MNHCHPHNHSCTSNRGSLAYYKEDQYKYNPLVRHIDIPATAMHDSLAITESSLIAFSSGFTIDIQHDFIYSDLY